MRSHPHHLIFNETDIGSYDSNYKMNPPLRTADDNAALLQGLIDGVFDLIATDHAPHTAFEKHQQDFGNAPFGVTGLETALPSLYQFFIKPGKFDWGVLVEHYSARPRILLGLDPVEIAAGNAGRARALRSCRAECVHQGVHAFEGIQHTLPQPGDRRAGRTGCRRR